MHKLLILKCFLAFLLGAMWVLTVSAEEASAPATPGTNAGAGNNAGNNAGTSLTRFALFIAQTQSGRAEFEQRVTDRNGKLIQQASGSFSFQRPGRFRWQYGKPYAQLIVSDGARVWIHDEDLNQVTVKRLDQALGSTPAALLAGNLDALKSFALTDQGAREGLEWLQAVPQSKEGGYERIRIGLGFSGPEVMELRDAFGQTTRLRFTAFVRNPVLDGNSFRFSPPKGADVIGDVPGRRPGAPAAAQPAAQP